MTNHLTYGLARLMDEQGAEPGGPHRFLLSSPGTKRDGLDLGPLPFRLDNFRKNPVGLMAHDYGSLPVGRGEIEVIQTSRGESLIVTAWLDIADPLGRLIDHKIRNGFLHAVSLGWDDIDARGVPSRVSGQRPTAHDVLEFSFVAVPGDADAVALKGSRGLVAEAIEALPETDERRADLSSLLEQIKVCEGEACEVQAERGISGVNHMETGTEELWVGAEAKLTPELAQLLRDAVLASLEAESDEDVWLSLNRWTNFDEPVSETTVSVDVSLPPEVLRALFMLAVGEGLDDTAGRSAEPSGNDADPPVDAEALTLARRQQTAMAAMFGALWVEDANDADDKQRQESRRSLIPEYERLGLIVPAFLPARAMAALSPKQRSALFVNGEIELMTTPTDPQARGGAAISKARQDRIRNNATAIADAAQDLLSMLDELGGSGERGADEGRGCGCGSGASHTSPQTPDPTEAPAAEADPATEPEAEIVIEAEDPMAALTLLLRELDPAIRDTLSRALESMAGQAEGTDPEQAVEPETGDEPEVNPETRSGDEPNPETDNTAEADALRARLDALLNQ